MQILLLFYYYYPGTIIIIVLLMSNYRSWDLAINVHLVAASNFLKGLDNNTANI